jgi:hypothetical protein
MILAELFQEIQIFLNNENITVDEEQEYKRLLEEFNQIPSYVERFKCEKQDTECSA